MTAISENKKEALRYASVRSVGLVVGYLFTFPLRIIFIALLGPAAYGVVRLLDLTGNYLSYAQLGSLKSLGRQVPLALGRGDQHEVNEIEAIVLTVNVFAILLSIAAVGVLYALGLIFNGLVSVPLFILFVLSFVAARTDSYLNTYAQAHGAFGAVAKRFLVTDIATPFLTIVCVWFWRVEGYVLATLLLSLFSITYYLLRLPRVPRLRLSFQFRKTVDLLRVGGLVWANTATDDFFQSVDLVIIAALLSVEQVGIYGFAAASFAIAINLPNTINAFIYRHMLVKRGAQGKESLPLVFGQYARGPLLLYLLVASTLMGWVYFGYQAIIQAYLSKYEAAVPIIGILVLGQMWFATNAFTSQYFNVAEQLPQRILVRCVLIALKAGAGILVLRAGYGIEGLAWVTMIAFIVSAVLFLGSTLKEIYGNFRSVARYLVQLAFVLGLLTLVMFGLDRWQVLPFVQANLSVWNIVLLAIDTGFKIVLYSIVAIALFALVFREYHVLGQFVEAAQYLANNALGRFRPRRLKLAPVDNSVND